LENQPQGQYVFEWVNYRDMIHDMISYFNRIHPVLEKIAESHKQPMPLGVINDKQENEIIDFFNSLSDNHADSNKDVTITVNYNDADGVKVGKNTIENVIQAWNKLKSDLVVKAAPVKQAPAAKAPAKDVPTKDVPATEATKK
jgi:hypothetical protein